MKEVIDICKKLINDDIDFVVGCRKLASLRNDLNQVGDVDFDIFVLVDSETDEYPDTIVRKNVKFRKEYLDKLDKQISDYICRIKPEIINSSNALLKKYKAKLDANVDG